MDREIKQLLELVDMNLTELIIRANNDISYSISEWVGQWIANNFIPKKLNIVISFYYNCIGELMHAWLSLNPRSPTGCTGCVKLYRQFEALLNFSPVFPEFQLDFGPSVTLPFVRSSEFGLPGDLLLLTDSTQHGNVALLHIDHSYLVDEYHLKANTGNLKFLVEFAVSSSELFLSEHLQQLAVSCPNLCCLNLEYSKSCLKDLRGLHAIASECQNLQGLNL